MLQNCGECQWKYPDTLLNPMFLGSLGYTTPICGICALEISNRELGVERKQFTGEIAEHMRQLAIKWRKKHKRHAPKGN